MSSAADIAAARAQAVLARARLKADLDELRGAVSPGNAVARLRDQAEDAAVALRDRAVSTARERPLVVAGGAAAVVALALFGPLRRAAAGTGRILWRNRAALGQFIETRRDARKDPPR